MTTIEDEALETMRWLKAAEEREDTLSDAPGMKDVIAAIPHYPRTDEENIHEVADGILCAVLRSYGHNELVDVYESIFKYYI